MASACLVASILFVALGENPLRVPHYERALRESELISQELDDCLDGTIERAMTKEILAEDYRAGRIEFSELIDAYRDINARDSDMMESFHDYYPNCDDREIAARNAAMTVDHQLPRGDAGRTVLRRKLSADFSLLFPASRPLGFFD
jgi:hypothetical protein